MYSAPRVRLSSNKRFCLLPGVLGLNKQLPPFYEYAADHPSTTNKNMLWGGPFLLPPKEKHPREKYYQSCDKLSRHGDAKIPLLLPPKKLGKECVGISKARLHT